MKRIVAVFAAVMLWVGMLPVQPTTAVAFVAATGAAVSLTGCTKAEVENYVNTILQSAEAVISVAEPNATWVQPLKNAITSLQQQEQNWLGGGAVQDLIQALNTIAAVTAVIPFTAPYSALIDIIVAGIDAVLALLPAQTTITANLAGLPPGPRYDHHNRVSIKDWLGHPSLRVYKARWAAAVQVNHLNVAPLK